MPNDVKEEVQVKKEIELLNMFRGEANIVNFINSWIE